MEPSGEVSSIITPVVRERPKGACCGKHVDMSEAEPNGQGVWGGSRDVGSMSQYVGERVVGQRSVVDAVGYQ